MSIIEIDDSEDRKDRLLRLAKAVRRKHILEQQRIQSDLGEQGRPGGLIHFVRYFWHILEPNKPFVDGWVIEAICMHLEAVTRGEITRLLINVPPGFAKSMLVNIFWPLWEWSAAGRPYIRYVTFAYAAHLTERDNGRFRDVIQSPDFQEVWGHVFRLTANGVTKPTNDARGWKFSSSIDGVGTGERGDRVLCLPGTQRILTDRGWLRIDEIVEDRLVVKVAGYNHITDELEWQDIEAYERNPGKEIYEVASEAGSFRCTGDHPVYAPGRGYARADSLQRGQQLVWTGGNVEMPPLRGDGASQAKPSAEVLQSTVQDCGGQEGCAGTKQPPMRGLRKDGLSTARASQENAGSAILQPRMPREVERGCEQSSVRRRADYAGMQVVRGEARAQAQFGGPRAVLFDKLRNQTQVGKRWIWRTAVAFGDCLRALPKAVQAHLSGDALLLSTMCGRGTRASDRGQREWSVCARECAAPLSARMDQDVQGDDPGTGREFLPAVRQPARDTQGAGCAPHRLQQGQSRTGQPDHALPVLPRQDARQEIAACAVDARTVRSVTAVGWEDAVFNVRVAPHHNYFVEGFLVHNCDDIHNVREGESEKVRSGTVQWVREGMSNRLNDMQSDAIVGIGQRVHEEDASAAMLTDKDYVHLCVPMVFDPGRKCRTKIGWEDPRTKEGELAWPERFPLAVVNKLKTTLGPYAFSAQYQQAPSPRGGGIIKSEWWQVWDEPTYPQCYYRWASADTAYTEKEENDPTGFTCWGLFEIAGQPQIIMMDAWRKRLELHIPARWTDERSPEHRLKLVQAWRKAAWAQKERAERDGTHVVDPVIGPEIEPWASFVMHGVNTADRWPGETYEDWKLRTQDHWGLCEWLVHSCRRFSVNELIIEGKASGISVAQELRRLNGNEGWGVKLVTPEGDKVARAYAVQSIFSAGLVHAPQRAWAEMVIEEVSGFPKGRYKDLTDSTTMALKHIREIGLLVRPEERLLQDEMATRYVPQSKPLYPT